MEFPVVESLEKLDQIIERDYGKDVLAALKDSSADQADTVRKLKEAGLNGRSEAIERMYNLHRQEFDRKESLMSKAWKGTKEVLTAPFRWTWSAFKKHPVLTTVGVAALALGGAAGYLYYAGQLESALTAVGAEKVSSFFTKAAAKLAPLTAPTPIVEGAGEAGLGGASVGIDEATTTAM